MAVTECWLPEESTKKNRSNNCCPRSGVKCNQVSLPLFMIIVNIELRLQGFLLEGTLMRAMDSQWLVCMTAVKIIKEYSTACICSISQGVDLTSVQ